MRMSRVIWSLVLTLLLPGLTLGQVGPTAASLSLGIPGNAPLTSLEGGRVAGVIAEATVRVLQTMGHTVAPRPLPFKRMYQWLHSGQLDVAVSVLATPERTALAHYSMPIVTEYTIVMVPKGQAFPLRRLTDLQGKRLGGQLGFVYPRLDRLELELLRESDYTTNLQKLAAGKLDGALLGSITGPFLVRRLGLQDKLETLSHAIEAVPLGAALNKAVFTAADLAVFNAALQALHNSPEWRTILSTNGVADLFHAWPVLTE